MNAWALLVVAWACFVPSAVPAAGLPEPGLAMFGGVAGVSSSTLTSSSLSSLNLTTRLGLEQVVVTSKWVVLNGTVFYFAQVPFETRQFPVGSRLDPTPNTFELPSAPATFTRGAGLNGRPLEFVNPAQATFTFGPADRGKVERVDLRLPGAPTDVDTDGDGLSDAAELLAGTDPRDRNSVLKAVSELRPELHAGEFVGITIDWQSVPGRRYQVERAVRLGAPFIGISGAITAQAERTRFRDAEATGSGPFFYRIRVE
ncbi:MAG: thrombospondin type 3 repeat-containing protein [Verrucomicrobiota bacterium]